MENKEPHLIAMPMRSPSSGSGQLLQILLCSYDAAWCQSASVVLFCKCVHNQPIKSNIRSIPKANWYHVASGKHTS